MSSAITRAFLVRQGATTLSADDRFAGETDVALSDLGREQARRLAVRLTSEKIAAVYASPLGRTVETAKILSARMVWMCRSAMACAKFRAGIGNN